MLTDRSQPATVNGKPALPAAAYIDRYGFAVDERGAIPYSN